MIICLVNKIEV